MQNVEKRNHENFRAARIRGDVSVSEREKKAEHVGDSHSHQGVEGVQRQNTRVLRDFRLRVHGAEPGTADGVDAVDCDKNKKKYGDVDEKSEAPARAGGAPLRRRNGRGELRFGGG